MVVTDVFGVRTLVRPVADTAGSEQQRRGMYHLNRVGEADSMDRRLFLPPATPKL